MDRRMRQGQAGKRSRGRNGRRIHNPRSQVFDSNGPNVRIRGNALQICEKYQQLARDNSSAGDWVSTENMLQHAEHYFRLYTASQTPQGGDGRQPQAAGQPRPQNGAGDGPAGPQQSNGQDTGSESGPTQP